MKIKRMLTFVCAALFLTWTLNIIAYAQGTTITVDNDALSSTGSTHTGSSEEFKYITGGTLKNGDARIANSGGAYQYFYHQIPVPLTANQGSCSLRAFLYHNDFTDPGAVYVVMGSESYATLGTIVGRINQATAPAGWSYIGARTRFSTQKWGHGAIVGTSGKGSQYAAGADQIEITYS